MIEIGSKVKNFELPNQYGEIVSLDSFKGKKVVIYFYPKDNTPGCTKQACSYKDFYNELLAINTEVIGISKDSPKSHLKFKEKYNLPFNLLSDENLDVIKYFDVWKEKSMYGKTYFGIVRSTFILDQNGVLVNRLEKVKPTEDVNNVLTFLHNE